MQLSHNQDLDVGYLARQAYSTLKIAVDSVTDIKDIEAANDSYLALNTAIVRLGRDLPRETAAAYRKEIALGALIILGRKGLLPQRASPASAEELQALAKELKAALQEGKIDNARQAACELATTSAGIEYIMQNLGELRKSHQPTP